MKLFSSKNQFGFTLVELTIVVLIMVTIFTVVLVNYRSAEKKKRVALAADTIISALRTVQNNALTGRQIASSTCNQGRSASEYQIFFDASNTFVVSAFDKCGAVFTLETFKLPGQTNMAANGLRVIIGGASYTESSISLRFRPPFSSMTVLRGSQTTIQPFERFEIDVTNTDSSYTKTVTLDGISGRIE